MLKPDRSIDMVTDISYFMNTVGERGGVVCAATGTGQFGTGASMDDANNVVAYLTHADVSGKYPIGILAQDVVNIDQTKQVVNFLRDEAQVGSKVTIYRKGFVVTDMIAAGSATGTVFPIPAYAGGNGLLVGNGANFTTASGYRQVGMFMGRVDSDGFVKVYIDV
jgi:hypothetical protein